MEPTLREAEAAYSSIYKHHAPLIRFLKGSGTPRPKVLSVAADLCLNAKLRRVLQGEGLDPEVVRPLLEEARLAGATWMRPPWVCCWQPTSSVWPKNFSDNLTIFLSWRSLNKAAKLVRVLPFEVNLWKTQNICYKILHARCPDFKEKAGLGDENAREWIRNAMVLAENFIIRMPKSPVNSKPANG